MDTFKKGRTHPIPLRKRAKTNYGVLAVIESGKTELDHRYLTFILADQLYGTPVTQVTEIHQLIDITRVPKVPDFIRGVINLRGKVIPVVDLRSKFGTTVTPTTKQTSIIVVESESGQIGAIVDSVQSVLEFSSAEIESPPVFENSQDQQPCFGVGKIEDAIVILVNLSQTLSGANLSAKVNMTPAELLGH
jgi:purine-binding chemotaxis protein CheW